MLKLFAILLIGAGLWACSSALRIEAKSNITPVTSDKEQANRMDSLISPYKTQMNQEMSEVIAVSTSNYIKGRPNSPLNNWAADALHAFFKDSLPTNAAIISLLNVGGLRSTLNSGEITLSDLYKLMPFDNEVVLVKMPMNSLDSLAKYLLKSGGEPIAGAILKQGKLQFTEGVFSDSFWIITSDYLYNGGDKMDFFRLELEKIQTGILLRDVFILSAKSQGTLKFSADQRIFFE
jgi:2',3'-cyclic-nucleotide 2'-phosphodiesterase (5'-nucleotidase family)